MRLRRLGPIIKWLARSFFVIDLMMASWRFMPLVSRSRPCSAAAAPGIISKSDCMLPIFLTCWNCASMSSSVNSFLAIFFCMAAAASMSTFSCAFSTRLTTSPMPSMRLAMRSGWKTSKSSVFSPVPIKRMGFPVIDFNERAAPPRASESNLVRMTPLRPSCSSKDLAMSTAFWPVIASATKIVSTGSAAFLIWTSSAIMDWSICKRPAVSKMIVSRPFFLA